MYILPYFLENEAKNLLKIKLSKIITDITDDLFLNSYERKKYFNVCNTCHRSIFTIFGLLEFDRVYYYDKKDRTKHFSLLTLYLNFLNMIDMTV